MPLVKKEENKLYKQKEIMEISMALKKKPLLYQLMETAVEVQSVEAIKQATDFLKGAKKNED